MKQKSLEAVLYSTLGVAVMFAAVVGFNIVSATLKQRADLTAEKAHTLSPGTRAILKKLDTPVKLRLYCTQVENATPETVFLTTYSKQVEDLLDELRQQSQGKLVVEKLNPQPDSDAEDRAKMDGIEGQPLPPYGENFYLGLAISQLDDTIAIPFLSPTREKLLEYDIMRAVSQVSTPEKPVVGVLSGLPVFGMPMNPVMMQMGRQGQDPWILITELKRDFNVKEIPMSADKIDDDVKVLVVIYPKDISETLQYAVDQFVLRGGKLVAYLDPKSLADSGNAMMNPLQRATGGGATLEKLLKAWGLEFDMGKVVADMNYKTTIRGRTGQPEETPTVLSLTKQAVGTEDVITSQIDSLMLVYAGAFTGSPAPGLQQTVLLRSSPNAELVDKVMAEFGVSDKDFKPSGTPYNLAVRLTGKFKTAFPDGKPGAKTDDKKPDADKKDAEKKDDTAKADNSLKESAGENSVVLFGDSDMLFDPVVAQVQNLFGQKIIIPQNGDLNLAQSLVEQMAGDSNLIAVRSRASLNRPFTVVKAMEEKAQERYRGRIKELEASLQDTQTKLNELQRTKDKGQQRYILSPEQQQELANFNKKRAEANKELKQVRKDLRHDIDSLENRLKWANIAIMPLAVTLSGILVAVYKRKRTAAK